MTTAAWSASLSDVAEETVEVGIGTPLASERFLERDAPPACACTLGVLRLLDNVAGGTDGASTDGGVRSSCKLGDADPARTGGTRGPRTSISRVCSAESTDAGDSVRSAKHEQGSTEHHSGFEAHG